MIKYCEDCVKKEVCKIYEYLNKCPCYTIEGSNCLWEPTINMDRCLQKLKKDDIK